MNLSVDLNTVLANARKTFELNARRYREQAEAAEARRDRPENVYIRESFTQQIEQARRCEARWEARAREAANGYFLAAPEDLNDPEYISEYSDLFSACQGDGRVVYRETPEGETIQRIAGTGGDTPDTGPNQGRVS